MLLFCEYFLRKTKLFVFQKLRVTIHSDVLKTVKEVGAEINMEVDKTAVSLVAELVWKKMEVISQDLELFAR